MAKRVASVHRVQPDRRIARQVIPSKPHHTSLDTYPASHFKVTNNGKFAWGLYAHAVFPAGRSLAVRKGTYRNVAVRGRVPLPDLLVLSAQSDWEDAVQEAFDHIELIIKNNPTKTMAAILVRPDVQQALDYAGNEGADAAVRAINDIWDSEGAPTNSPYLSQVINTLTTNGATFASRMTEALQNADSSKAMNILNKDRLRAAAAESVIRTRARNERAIEVMRKAGVTHLQWKARTYPGTDKFLPSVCSTCRAYHNQIINLGASFDLQILKEHGLKPYGSLICPPAHPNCQCRVVPVRK